MSNSNPAPTEWGRFQMQWGAQTWVMGIVNVTPDSFSGDGLAIDADPQVWATLASEQGLRQAAEGARMIDVGGMSSRPGAAEIPADVEMQRVVPAIRALAEALPRDIPISVDTYRVEVARAALEAGASMINDITGLRAEPELATLAASAGVPIILMANRRLMEHREVVADVTRFLAASIDRALAAGVPWNHIVVDPGFGFGNTPEENIALIRNIGVLRGALGRPVLLGVSRKSSLGHLLGNVPPEDRLEASLAAAVAGAINGADIIRAHDVQANVRALRIADAIAHQ